MDNTDKIFEILQKSTVGSMVECQYVVEKAKRAKDEDDEFDKATITTANKDRHGDIVKTSGIDTKHYMTNPVVLFQHGHSLSGTLPVGKATELKMHRSSIDATWQWATESLNPMAQHVKAQWREGFLNATSIGFLAVEVNIIEDDKKDTWFPNYEITKSELLEFSIVAVPSNRESLRKNFELQLMPFLQKLASDQRELFGMVQSVKDMLQLAQPVDIAKQYREKGIVPTLAEGATLEIHDAFLTEKGFTLPEKFELLKSHGIESLIEFYSDNGTRTSKVTLPPVDDKGIEKLGISTVDNVRTNHVELFSPTELQQMQLLLANGLN